MKFPLLVFDWDGTLMDSEARIVGCMQAAIQDVGLPALETAAIRNIIGLGLREALEQLFPGCTEPVRQRVVESYRYHFLGGYHAASPLFPGALETLTALRERGYLLAVATGKGRQGLDSVLRETGCRSLFDATRCADESFSKPHPQMLLDIMDELNVPPRATLMIGDTEYDMRMAANAGAAALAVSYGVHERERLLQCGPLDCLDSISALPVWLDS
ncbi:MAG: HAD-IA family hydrolase [Pseudomonadota bacterium]